MHTRYLLIPYHKHPGQLLELPSPRFVVNFYDALQDSLLTVLMIIVMSLQLIRVGKASNIAAVLPITANTADADVVMLTENGQIKRTALDMFTSMSSRGLIAMKLRVRILVYILRIPFHSLETN